MKLLGERNWYLPSRLTWLPSTSHAKTGTHEPATGLAGAAITSD
jgi:hypothetical protein